MVGSIPASSDTVESPFKEDKAEVIEFISGIALRVFLAVDAYKAHVNSRYYQAESNNCSLQSGLRVRGEL
jgi:hypothetical protein